MKKRSGFVANSSSSSYICDVCGETKAGMDMSLSDAYMLQCVNGHIFCEDHAIGDIPKYPSKQNAIEQLTRNIDFYRSYSKKNNNYKEILKEKEKLLSQINSTKEKDWDDFCKKMDIGNELDYYWREDVPKKHCPICSLDSITNNMKLTYLISKFGINQEELEKEIKSNFSDYDELMKYSKGVKI